MRYDPFLLIENASGNWYNENDFSRLKLIGVIEMRQATFSIPILFEDNHLLVVEKPVNMPSQGDASKDPDLLSILKEDIKIRYQKPGNVYLGLVHRLDRPVGGVMVFAKT